MMKFTSKMKGPAMQIAGPTSLPFACYVTGTSPARSSSAGPLAVTVMNEACSLRHRPAT